MSITRALLSVSDKTGLEALVKGLHQQGVELLSTGGTAKFIADLSIPVIEVSDFTGFPELFDGRVKTLHPKVHGGLLYRRDLEDHQNQATANDIKPIDLVVVNLYPFEETVAKKDVSRSEAIEQIDIGGPSMLRSAAKNHGSVTVIVDPADYSVVLSEMAEHKGNTTLKTRERLAIKVFQRTAAYDAAIAAYLNDQQETEASFSISLPLCQELRYGENPHQAASLYGKFNDYFKQLQGKGLSYTNVIDIAAAAELILEFRRPAVAILKHTNPCGVGADEHDLRLAWEKAFETDRQAPFGGVIVCNRPLGIGLARVISEIFTDVIIAPEFETDARALLQKKKNLRLIRMNEAFRETLTEPVIHSAPGGILVMDHDSRALGLEEIEKKVVSQRPPTADEIEAMRFAWRIVKHVKSNAIVFTTSDRTLGIGAGQMSRIDSCRIATWKAEQAGLSLKGSVVASDAMFPFADGLINALDAGATAAIQPGGSIRDEEVIKAANDRDAAMIFTGHRHFLH
ncbi:MAG: bifunctional phosphoribosylaminoimidazolecarboxamide formyltransferase/IMP cyclohydrolase [Verrucomicrobiales bacterium]|jgi:phosphoribosylaminoimidazolecarboxamide formyltransferase/IMP cyclohydrolase|nr:bifunctional phosphoribosylaminoimidazolecarboxamide formyltransferase/IMP cyclohydrolase [Verrucomicrobiales bacterium]MBP9223074.1 bifunctional phosphoribosylaminoimidazolecarboxamide formyltransferase/IMP cyclohydrolase [Verrucomicrobiales bacterium]HQZ26662.1 bifunctional phosphoribosylaminoimidazolecarboxamide formyltransferase/IMP cyclohydrolase [Verrucomicrobiales bacterium]